MARKPSVADLLAQKEAKQKKLLLLLVPVFLALIVWQGPKTYKAFTGGSAAPPPAAPAGTTTTTPSPEPGTPAPRRVSTETVDPRRHPSTSAKRRAAQWRLTPPYFMRVSLIAAARTSASLSPASTTSPTKNVCEPKSCAERTSQESFVLTAAELQAALSGPGT